MAKKTKKKGTEFDTKKIGRVLGCFALGFGVLLLIALISFIGSEKNWLGPIFGKMIPETFVYIFGNLSATIVSVALICWGIWLLLAGEFPRFLKACCGFSALCILCPATLALVSAAAGNLNLKANTLYASGGRLGYFWVKVLIQPVFGSTNFLFPFVILGIIFFAVAVSLFGLKLSHFSCVKIPFTFIAGWWANRPKKELEPETEKPENPKPKKPSKKDDSDAVKKLLEKERAEAISKDWNSDYTIYSGQAKPFRGNAGAFDGTLPVENQPVVKEASSFTVTSTEKAAKTQNISSDYPNVAEREIEEKERYLRENEKNLGALEVRALRDEIAHLRQVQQMNNWENNRQQRPSIKGIIERDDEKNSPENSNFNLDNAKEKSKKDESIFNLEEALKKSKENNSLKTEIVSENEPAELTESKVNVEEKTVAPETQYDEYVIPKVDEILEAPPEQKPDYTAQELDEISHQLEEQLENFKVKGKVLGISTGPMITRFEVEPGPGVKVGRFSSLHEDLALALKAKSIRILAPIPGKSLVGVEVPNRKLQTVFCRDIFESPLFKPQPDKLIIALGKDITGNPYTMDLCRAPHVLIAGQTGSGKSVCINTLMASLLFSKTPDELRMILVDPKVVELKLYEDIPHLLAPVVTQPDVAVSALKWACVEMDRRYEELAKWKVRNLVGYNQKRREQQEVIRKIQEMKAAYESAKKLADKVEEENRTAKETALANGTPALELQPIPPVPSLSEIPPMPETIMENLPYIVVVIDELADVMMVAGKEVEKYIARIAQKARAVGIHLVIATQRPSVNVITGLIKANLPARISFKVASQIDSRTVLDQAGAEKLLGRGDMLYRSGDDPEPTRVHGGFLTDEEVEKLADVCANQNVHYERLTTFDIEDPSDTGESGEEKAGFLDKLDRLAFDVARYGLERGSLSTSEVQRHFAVGFSRAGKIVDQLERLNICGKKNGSKPREMLVADEQALFERWPK